MCDPFEQCLLNDFQHQLMLRIHASLILLLIKTNYSYAMLRFYGCYCISKVLIVIFDEGKNAGIDFPRKFHSYIFFTNNLLFSFIIRFTNQSAGFSSSFFLVFSVFVVVFFNVAGISGVSIFS